MTLVSIDAASGCRIPRWCSSPTASGCRRWWRRFSREDLLRSFDLVAQAEADVRLASQPRYALEMALLKWIHLRKLVPLADLIGQLEKGGVSPPPRAFGRSRAGRAQAAAVVCRAAVISATPGRAAAPNGVSATSGRAGADAAGQPCRQRRRTVPCRPTSRNGSWRNSSGRTARSSTCTSPRHSGSRSTAAAWSSPSARCTRRCASRWTRGGSGWSRSPSRWPAARSASRRRALRRRRSGDTTAGRWRVARGQQPAAPDADLKARALADGGVQAMLDVFPAEIREVEEIK